MLFKVSDQFHSLSLGIIQIAAGEIDEEDMAMEEEIVVEVEEDFVAAMETEVVAMIEAVVEGVVVETEAAVMATAEAAAVTHVGAKSRFAPVLAWR
jgi:hypothetical protein